MMSFTLASHSVVGGQDLGALSATEFSKSSHNSEPWNVQSSTFQIRPKEPPESSALYIPLSVASLANLESFLIHQSPSMLTESHVPMECLEMRGILNNYICTAVQKIKSPSPEPVLIVPADPQKTILSQRSR